MKEGALMTILNDMFSNVKSTAEMVTKKAGVIVDVSKLKKEISDLNYELNLLISELGQLTYKSKKECNVSEDDINSKITKIDEIKEQIEALTKEVITLRNKKRCPSCGRQCDVAFGYCPICGAKLPEQPKEEEKEVEKEEVTPADEQKEPAETSETEEAPKDIK
jgi:tetrahydromethanopterin S-methyltransferase subunit G